MITKFSTYRQTWFTAWRWLLALLIVLGTNVTTLTPAAYAFPAKSTCVVGWGNDNSGQATPPPTQRRSGDCRRGVSQPGAQIGWHGCRLGR